jgi:hypothetical protein
MNVNFEFIDKYITCKYIIVTNYYFSVVLKEPLLCPSNSKARAAIHNGEFLDLSLTGKLSFEPIHSI